MITVAPYSPDWPVQFEAVKHDLEQILQGVPLVAIEHVGSTSVPGLAAKPILDVDVIVPRQQVNAAIRALERGGYRALGDLGVTDREAFTAPDDSPPRSVYVCTDGSLHLRNHLAVREVLRSRRDLRDAYARVKIELAGDASLSRTQYVAGKSDVLQLILEAAELSADERASILRLNAPDRLK